MQTEAIINSFKTDLINHNIATASELICLIKAKKIHPQEYLYLCLKRFKQCDGLIHSFTEINENLLKENLEEILENITPELNLSYVPFGVKDIFNVDKTTTSHGSPIYKNYRPGNDARAVFSMKFHGAFFFGKTETAEFGVHAEPRTRNPWDLSRTAGTSSSGSVAAVAAGIIPVALTTQTAGSTIRPASYCGVFGFKPTFGTIPRTAVLKTTDTLDTIGLVARSAEDLRLVYDCIRVRGWNYPHVFTQWDSIENTTQQNRFHKLRIGIPYGLRENYRPQFINHAFNKVTSYLTSQGHELVEVDMSKFFSIFTDHEEIYCKSLWYYFKYERENFANLLSDIFKNMILRGEEISPARYYELLERQSQLIKEFDQEMEKLNIDFLIEPSANSIAPLHGDISPANDNNLIWTYLHIPICTVPKMTFKDGLPVGCSIIGRKFSDYLLLNFANQLYFN